MTNRSVDLGMAFTYTGCGGRDLKGTKQNPKNLRTAPQTSHQTFDNPLNAALKVSLSPLVLAQQRGMLIPALGRDEIAYTRDTRVQASIALCAVRGVSLRRLVSR